jgi:hypothetical protein
MAAPMKATSMIRPTSSMTLCASTTIASLILRR